MTERVSVKFENLASEEGLRRLLRRYNVVLVYGKPATPKRSPATTTLERVLVFPTGVPLKPDPGDEPSNRGTSMRALAALASKTAVAASLSEFLHEADPLKTQKALSELTELLSNDDLQTLIDLVHDREFSAEDWEAALSPLRGIL